MRYIEGIPRNQTTLFPESLDDHIDNEHSARVIDAFVDTIDIPSMGFTHSFSAQTGRKAYSPADLLKLYIYGYLNQITSTRRLEKECHRNIEVMWLLKRLAPDFKTIADFRKDNGTAIRACCRQFIGLCQQAGLIAGQLIALDGSKFKAAASKDQILTQGKLSKQLARVDAQIDDYLSKLEQSESAESCEVNSTQIEEILTMLDEKKQTLTSQQQVLKERNEKQYCQTEEDAKLMRSGRNGMIAGYNVQTAVDEQHRMIIHHEVVQDANDTRQLQPMAEAVKEVLATEPIHVVADAGYSNGEQIAGCEAQQISIHLPANRAKNNQGDYFQKSDFTYDETADNFRCPAGETLNYKTYSSKNKLRLYTTDNCQKCKLKTRCTAGEKRWISRHFHEQAFDQVKANVAKTPEIMKKRMAIVEPPFAILKRMMSQGRFRCWGLKAVKSEMAIGILSYNLMKAINVMGVRKLLIQLNYC